MSRSIRPRLNPSGLIPWLVGFQGLFYFYLRGIFNHFIWRIIRFTQIPGKDPELFTAKPTNILEYFWVLSGLTYWKEQIFSLIGYAFTDRHDSFVNSNKIRSVRFEAQMYVLAYVVLLALSLQTKSTLLLEVWIVPVMIGQPMLRAFLLAEHTLCPEIKHMFSNTRTNDFQFFNAAIVLEYELSCRTSCLSGYSFSSTFQNA